MEDNSGKEDRNEEIQRQMGVEGTLYEDIVKQLIWDGHLQRMDDQRLPKRVDPHKTPKENYQRKFRMRVS